MKILFLTRRFWPDIGGVETHVMEVTKCLEKLGHEVTIVTEESPSTQAQQGAKDIGNSINATVYRIPVSGNEKKKKHEIWKWFRQHKDLVENADIVHCHDVFFWYLPFRFRYPRKKVYTTFHGYETKYPPMGKAVFVRKVSEKLSHGNICVGEFIKKWYGTKPSFVTYGGVTLPEQLEPYDPLTKKLRITFIGRIEKDTGVFLYKKLLELLKKNKIEFSFIALGEGSEKETFREFGEVPGFTEDIHRFLHKSDVVFASSYLAMLQSLSQKKLVIALYDNPLKKDYLIMSPFAKYIIAEESPEKAFEKLKFFILNPNRLKKMITEGSSWAEQQTWENVTKDYLKLWGMK